ncbi:hypothetical protein [Apibacter muscae]|uniref:hypothetical protein n=1 Tax=Apibacter muscae TaxID=2509004 RepID=UPI00162972FA|nr:hypothetical protein [Apibacter muscae]
METSIITTQEINSSVNKLEGYREKQLKVLEQNPFIEITDNKTYEEAKKARTNLVSARTEIEKVDKGIASILNNFRKGISDIKTNLISITKPAEDLQQEEVKRWEEIKEQEKLKKARIEEERKEKRLEELKPDKEKIVDFLASIKIVELPNLKDPDILKHLSSITIEINKVIDNKIIEIQDFK